MTALLGFTTIILLLVLILTKMASPIVALVLVPVATALVGGFGSDIPAYMTSGIGEIVSTAVMFIFAILFFGILTDAGTFAPLIKTLLKMAGNDPAKIGVATAVLAMAVHLDGSGAVTFLVVVPAMLPVFDTLRMRRTTLAMIVALAAGTMNIMPWGGPTIRAASALSVPVTEVFNPLILPVCAGLALVLCIAYFAGKKERIHSREQQAGPLSVAGEPGNQQATLARPQLLWVNYLLIVAAIGSLLSGVIPPHIVFIIAFVVALSINYPGIRSQGERVEAHAKPAILMAGILFAAGCFIGILTGTGMITAMSETIVSGIPPGVGTHLPVIVGVCSMPASLLFDPDSFYFGILPVLSGTAEQFNVSGIEVGRAAVLGQMTTGFPVSPLTGSTYLLVGLTGTDLGEHQKKTIPYAFLVTLVMLLVAIALGAVKL